MIHKHSFGLDILLDGEIIAFCRDVLCGAKMGRKEILACLNSCEETTTLGQLQKVGYQIGVQRGVGWSDEFQIAELILAIISDKGAGE